MVLRWSAATRAWRRVEGDPPEGLGRARVGLYETLLITVSAYALALHADRIARSWEVLTGRPLAAAPEVPPLGEGRDEAVRQGWPGLRFDVRSFPDGSADAEIRRRDRPAMKPPPLPLLLMELGAADAAYPHKSSEREHLTRAYKHAQGAGAHDALLVVAGELREAAAAFVGLVTADALVLPPLRQSVLASTTRTAVAEWCREQGRGVLERPIRAAELAGSGLIYGNALIGLVPAYVAGGPATPLPDWFDAAAIERRLTS
jgi:hypothetical protein